MTTATLDEGIFDYLTSHLGLAALIGTRLHPDYFSKDEELPAIAYSPEDVPSRSTNRRSSRTSAPSTKKAQWSTA